MIQKISKTEAIHARLQEEGKVTFLDRPEDIAAIEEMNAQLESVRREFQIKNHNSQISASSVILTA